MKKTETGRWLILAGAILLAMVFLGLVINTILMNTSPDYGHGVLNSPWNVLQPLFCYCSNLIGLLLVVAGLVIQWRGKAKTKTKTKTKA